MTWRYDSQTRDRRVLSWLAGQCPKLVKECPQFHASGSGRVRNFGLCYGCAQPCVLSPVRASGLPLTKTFDEPLTIVPPQPWIIGPPLCGDGLCALAPARKHATASKSDEESTQQRLLVEVIQVGSYQTRASVLGLAVARLQPFYAEFKIIPDELIPLQ